MKLRLPSKERLLQHAQRLLEGGKRTMGVLAGALISYRFVVTLLLAAVALELASLGVGTVRRLEIATQEARKTANLEKAAAEARALTQRAADNASASIGNGPAPIPPADPDLEASTSNGAPPLRPLDGDPTLTDGADTDAWISSWADDLTEDDGVDALADASTGEAGDKDGDGEEVDHFIRQGVLALNSGDVRKAILLLEEARALVPEHPATLYYLGMCYDKVFNPKKANEYYMQVFKMRDKAGKYFSWASRRLSYGVDNPAAMRGKLAFGPYRVNHSYNDRDGERVEVLLPVQLVPGEELNSDDIFIQIFFFDLVNKRRIEFAHSKPALAWEREQPDWKEGEENLIATFTAPPLTTEEREVYGDLTYYGFVAKLYYQGEPLDCISTPSALILHEQRLNLRGGGRTNDDPSRSLLPEDEGLEEAIPYSDFSEELDDTGS